MTIPTPLATRVQGMLLALTVFLLTAFTASGAGEPVVRRSVPPLAVAAEGMPVGTLVIEGPSVVSCGQSVTLTLKGCYCNICILWYYNGTYYASNNGSFTFTADGRGSSVTAIEHYNCSPSGTVVSYGVKQFNYSNTCP